MGIRVLRRIQNPSMVQFGRSLFAYASSAFAAVLQHLGITGHQDRVELRVSSLSKDESHETVERSAETR